MDFSFLYIFFSSAAQVIAKNTPKRCVFFALIENLFNWIFPFDNANEEKDDRKNKQDVDEPTKDMEADKPDEPEDK